MVGLFSATNKIGVGQHVHFSATDDLSYVGTGDVIWIFNNNQAYIHVKGPPALVEKTKDLPGENIIIVQLDSTSPFMGVWALL